MVKSKVLKKVVCASAFAVLGVCIMLGFAGCNKKPEKDAKWAGTTIAVGSDVHIGAAPERIEYFRSAFDTFYAMDPALDAVVFNGDVVDNGFDEEYKQYSDIVNEKKKEWTTYVATMGNHEWYRGGWGVDIIANGFTKEYQKAFVDGTGQPIQSDTVVNGIHIIAVAPDNEMDYYHSREVFIKRSVRAAAKEDPNKPIFLVVHKPVAYTVINSWDDATGGTTEYAPDWTDSFMEFLAQYPQIVYISGHTHDSVSEPLSIYQENFTSVNDGCIGNGDGLFIHVSNENVVTIHRLNTLDGSELGEPWVIDIPKVIESKDNFTYDKKRYDASATLTFPDPTFVLNEQGTDSVTITLPRATGEDEIGCGYALEYLVQILDKSTNTYVPVSPDYPGTRFGFFTKKGEINLDKQFTGLTPGTDYTLELFAVNALYKPSETITFDFSTLAE